jgi:putative flippase GtrA
MILPAKLRQTATFACVGLVATATHAIIALGVEAVFDLAPLAANFLGYSSAVGVSYFGHARLTFRRPARDRAQFLRFVAVSLLGLALNQVIVFAVTGLMGWPLWSALIPATLLAPAVTFIVSDLWAFRVPRSAATDSAP